MKINEKMSIPKRRSVWFKNRKQNKTKKFDTKNVETKTFCSNKNILQVKLNEEVQIKNFLNKNTVWFSRKKFVSETNRSSSI
jgi:hypothetical protein